MMNGSEGETPDSTHPGADMSQATQTATQTITTQISLTNLGNDRYEATRNALDHNDVGRLLVRSMSTSVLALVRGGADLDASVASVVASTFGWSVDDDSEIQSEIETEVGNYIARND